MLLPYCLWMNASINIVFVSKFNKRCNSASNIILSWIDLHRKTFNGCITWVMSHSWTLMNHWSSLSSEKLIWCTGAQCSRETSVSMSHHWLTQARQTCLDVCLFLLPPSLPPSGCLLEGKFIWHERWRKF